MTDREKVLHELDHQVADADWCDNDWKDNVPIWMLRDALAILREQEPIKPTFPHNVPAFPRCGACSHMLVGPPLTADSEIKYCWNCGRKVLWNG